MSDETKYHLARGEEILGDFNSLEIRELVAKGEVLPTDFVYLPATESWRAVLPPFPCRRWTPKDEDDGPLFYIAGNRVYGPRSLDEIQALYIAGHISRETLWCAVGMDEWLEFAEIADAIDKELQSQRHLQNAKDSLASGNLFGAALQFGTHLWNSIPQNPEQPVEKNQPKNGDGNQQWRDY